MSRIAHLKVYCPRCSLYTSIYVIEDGRASTQVKCQHCREVFEFAAGMVYSPVEHVETIPAWAEIAVAPAPQRQRVRYMKQRFPGKSRSLVTALWVLGGYGYLQMHNFYLGRYVTATIRLAVFLAATGSVLSASIAGRTESPQMVFFSLTLCGLVILNVVDLIGLWRKPKSDFCEHQFISCWCRLCGMVKQHDWSDGRCSDCGAIESA